MGRATNQILSILLSYFSCHSSSCIDSYLSTKGKRNLQEHHRPILMISTPLALIWLYSMKSFYNNFFRVLVEKLPNSLTLSPEDHSYTFLLVKGEKFWIKFLRTRPTLAFMMKFPRGKKEPIPAKEEAISATESLTILS